MAGELYGDYSRMPTVRGSHVRSVFAQQGRVVLDSDVNEQTALLLQQIRSVAADLIGPHGGPFGNVGFALERDGSGDKLDLKIGAGRYYVDGILVEVDEATSYYGQGAFHDRDEDDDDLPEAPFLAYLKVWERSVGAIQDPASREVALGHNGPDTTTRNRVVWQVLTTRDVFKFRKLTASAKADFLTAWQKWVDAQAADRATLKARANRPDDSDDDPCPTPPGSAYRGTENQLYRVEIHSVRLDNAGKVEAATFKWSRDNGSATYPIEFLNGKVATVTSLGRDRGLMIDVGDWVEVVDDRYMLYPGAGPFGRATSPLLRVVDVETLDRTVTLGAAPDGSVGQDPDRHRFLRRWDQNCRPTSDAPESLYTSQGCDVQFSDANDVWIDLEDGIQVAFRNGILHVGDYWLIAARTETGDVEWPQVVVDPTAASPQPAGPQALPPLGVDYAFAPLGIVRAGAVDDLRLEFAPLAK